MKVLSKKMYFYVFFILFFLILRESGSLLTCYVQPQQVHLSFGDTANDLIVTWSTRDSTKESIVKYGEIGESTVTIIHGDEIYVKEINQYIHRSTMKDLKCDTEYVYNVGSIFGWSERFSFATPPCGLNDPIRVGIFGDLGNKNGRALSYLQNEAQNGNFHLMLHIGDIAYNINDHKGKLGNEFMRQIQPIAAYVPYMVAVGNHEEYKNFSHYKNRFSMPRYDEFENMFYSFDIGPVHFIAVNSEAYYFYSKYGRDTVVTHYNWLREDLKNATKKENRKARPWIILYGHRPMYCTNDGGGKNGCWAQTKLNNPDRIGIMNGNGQLEHGLEELLYEFGVDLFVAGHDHSYERTLPVYNLTICSGSQDSPYMNPMAPVHIVTGAAGMYDGPEPFQPDPPEWSAFRDTTYSYTRLTIYNKTHIYWEQVSVFDDRRPNETRWPVVIDDVWLVKQRHHVYRS